MSRREDRGLGWHLVARGLCEIGDYACDGNGLGPASTEEGLACQQKRKKTLGT